MANTVRIIPESGSITFARGIASISSSLSGATTAPLQIDAAGNLLLKSGSIDLVKFTGTSVLIDNTAIFKVPQETSTPPGAAIGTLYVNTNTNNIDVVGNGGSTTQVLGEKGQKGVTGAQGPIGPKGQKGDTGSWS